MHVVNGIVFAGIGVIVDSVGRHVADVVEVGVGCVGKFGGVAGAVGVTDVWVVANVWYVRVHVAVYCICVDYNSCNVVVYHRSIVDVAHVFVVCSSDGGRGVAIGAVVVTPTQATPPSTTCTSSPICTPDTPTMTPQTPHYKMPTPPAPATSVTLPPA